MGKKTKFERLMDLVEKGKTYAMKKAAAYQIGFLQKEFSYSFTYLLNKFYPLLMHHDFDCRCATALSLRYLIPNCKPDHFEWNSDRFLLKLSHFSLKNLLKQKKFLTHESTIHTESTNTYKDQTFMINSTSQIAELCQLSELLISQLSSNNWFYRHGAVIGLAEIINNAVPSEYLEDLAVQLLTLVSIDKFSDFGVSETARFPVREPACKLLSRFLMNNIEESVRIINDFLSHYESWELPNMAWLIMRGMIERDPNIFDHSWLLEHFIRTISDDQIVTDVISSAIYCIYPVLDRMNSIDIILEKLWKLVSNIDDLAAYNSIALLSIEKIIRETKNSQFISIKTMKDIMKLIGIGQTETKESGYKLLRTIMADFSLEIWDSINFKDYAFDIVKLNLNESSILKASIPLFDSLSKLLQAKSIVFDESFAVSICSFIGKHPVYSTSFSRNLAVISGVSTLITLPGEHPVYSGLDSVFGVLYILILSLTKNTKRPELPLVSQRTISSNPNKLFLKLFEISTKNVIEIFEEAINQDVPIRFYISKFIGRFLKEGKHIKKILEISDMATEIEYYVPVVFNDSDMYSNMIKSSEKSARAQAIEIVLTDSVFEVPKSISTKSDLMLYMFYVESKQILSPGSVEQLISKIVTQDRLVSSISAYIASKYAVTHPESFLSPYIIGLSKRDFFVGDAEFIDLYLTRMPLDQVHWGSFFVLPSIQHIASPDEHLRRLSSHSLAHIVRLLPLEQGDTSVLPLELREIKRNSQEYLKPLFDMSQIKDFVITPYPTVEPRDYQRNGINWLGFLHSFGLNGILADDMGLGKTFQCLCVISTAHYKCDYKALSLVICPSAVVHHWQQEINRFFPDLQVQKICTKDEFSMPIYLEFNGVIVTTYQIMRTHIVAITERKLEYCVLDEGHLIKNKDAKTSKAAALIIAEHRLILSGTPIQNNATELWALFDFLMPGYLGSKSEFNAHFEKPIQGMFKENAKESDTEQGKSALEKLHGQVLPFILRRLKCDVLTSLPPKAFFTEFVQMTPQQKDLLRLIRDDGTDGEVNESSFTKSINERLLCIHPCLVPGSTVPRDIAYSAKLKALKKLLLRLGFGGGDETMKTKAIIFCNSNETIDIVIELVVKQISDLTYVVLDSRVPDRDRGSVVNAFQKDEGPDLFIATISVGGHGINLTAASSVIFVENSWNPAVDLQAMDRAHRLGQRNQVSVFNIITENTIDQRIIEAQKRKEMIQRALVNDDEKDASSFISKIQDEGAINNLGTTNDELGHDKHQYEQL